MFIFKCYGEDDKQTFLATLKNVSTNETIQVSKNLFHFDYKQTNFEKVKLWASKLVRNANENIDELTMNFSRLEKRDNEIEEQQKIFLTQQKDLENLTTSETNIQMRPEDRKILGLLAKRIESVNGDISAYTDIITNIERAIEKARLRE